MADTTCHVFHAAGTDEVPFTAEEVQNHLDSGQFFWVDDAFGAVRHEEQLTKDWARSMPHIMSAISKGARVVLTARSYIYQDARPLLKEYAYRGCASSKYSSTSRT